MSDKSDKIVSDNIEILGRLYPIRCPEAELEALQHAAKYVNQKMTEVKESGKVINLERIAIITALNMAYQYLALEQQNYSYVETVNRRIKQLQDKLEVALSQAQQTELIYNTAE